MMSNNKKPTINLLKLNQSYILEQLRLEEALLRADDRNWCIINEGSLPAIVMGASGKAEKLIDLALVQNIPIPIIKRFSGGGTVVVDEDTYFVTFICNSPSLKLMCYPDQILLWTKALYQHVFVNLDFNLVENDYVLGNKKFGGNAQYFRKERFLHHTSFLWNFKSEKMQYLLMPDRKPKYRDQRDHLDFLCKLNDHFSNKDIFRQKIIHGLDQYFHVEVTNLAIASQITHQPHRQATSLINV